MGICDNCHAGCCRSFAIPLNGADIIRIERANGLDFWDFVCRWEDRAGLIARNQAPHFHFDDEPATPFAICLKQAQSDLFPKTRKCRFLVECPPDDDHPLGVARCGIYRSRPDACASFPAVLDHSGQLAVIHDVPERGLPADQGDVYKLCPRPWEPEDFDQLDTVQRLVVSRYEMQIFQQIADAWNRRQGPWNAFPEFLRSIYANRVVKPPVSAPEEKPAHGLRVVHPEDDDDHSMAAAA